VFSGGGQLNYLVGEFNDIVVFPILIRDGLCLNINDCRNHEYSLATSTSSSIDLSFYGIRNNKTVDAIMIEIIKSKIPIRQANFYKENHSGILNLDFFHTIIASYFKSREQ